MDRLSQIETVLVLFLQEFVKMNAQVTALVNQVATNVATEAKAAAAFVALAAQVADLNAKLAVAVAHDFGDEDVAALTKAAGDLSVSATALASATPA